MATKRAAWLALLAASGLGMCAAQSDLGGSVAGRVAGPDGQSVRGALVRIENMANGEHRDGISDGEGDFRFAEVTPGDYRLQVHAQGLSDWEADHVAVGLGLVTQLHASLVLLSVHRTVLVDARLRGVEAGSSSRVGSESLEELPNELPNNGQHWSSLAALFSAATTDDSGGMSFRGLSPLMNSIALDGTDHTLAFRGRERGTAGNGFATVQSAVGEFQVNGNGFSAASGRAGGGAINTITKGGSRSMHGQAVFYDRGAVGQSFNAFSKVMQAEPAGTTAAGQPVLYLNGEPITYVDVPYHAPDRRQQWEVSAGGDAAGTGGLVFRMGARRRARRGRRAVIRGGRWMRGRRSFLTCSRARRRRISTPMRRSRVRPRRRWRTLTGGFGIRRSIRWRLRWSRSWGRARC